MAGYSGMILTKAGMQLQAQAQIGGELRITKIAVGDGILASGESVEDLTSLKNQIMTLGIQDMQVIDSQSRIRALITNDNLTTGFFLREVGVFAKIGAAGTETLYSYTNASDKADYLPNKGINVVEEVLEVYIIVGNAQNVTCVINDRVTLATKLDIEESIAQHDESLNAHADVIDTHNSNPNAHTVAINKHNINLNAHADLLHLWKPTHTYAVGDIVYSTNLPSYAYAECTVAGVTLATEPTWPAVDSTVTDGTVTWKVRDIKSGSGEQVGSIKAWLANAAPAGWLACDTGALVSRATYPQLWEWVQANAPLITEAAWQTQAAVQSSVGYYSSGDGSTTFRLPRLVDYVRGGLLSDVGSWQNDAIRNITGSYSSNKSSEGINSVLGAFTGTNATSSETSGHASGTFNSRSNIKFDASEVVPTADENRPKTVQMLYCVKAFDAPTNQGMIDITELANDVAGKVPYADFTGVNQSMATNGWQKLPGGLILQWGVITTASSGALNLVFPISFPNTALNVFTTDIRNSIASTSMGVHSTLTATGCTVYSSSAIADTFCWFAIGH